MLSSGLPVYGMEEKELIANCKKGELKAQRLLYERFSSAMYVICLRFTKDEDEAKDVLQESFIKVFKNIERFREESSLYYWIKRIVINTAINHQRSQLFLHTDITDLSLEHPNGVEEAIYQYDYQELLKLLQALPDGCRIIFNLYAIEGYKHREIAEKLGINEGTSKSQYNRARMLLQEMVLQLEKPLYGETRGL
jgi:RNA polymerase sigma-70 factor (ECF subfamily)